MPHGLFIWMGPSEVPPAWQPIFNRYKLIWVSANVAGDRHGGDHRLQLPLDAVDNLKKSYNIDEDRVYVGGISAGAGLAVDMVCGFPDVLSRRLFPHGRPVLRDLQALPDAGIPPSSGRRLRGGSAHQVRKDMRLVLMRGETDPIFPPQEKTAANAKASRSMDSPAPPTSKCRASGTTSPTPRGLKRESSPSTRRRPRPRPSPGRTTQPNPLPAQSRRPKGSCPPRAADRPGQPDRPRTRRPGPALFASDSSPNTPPPPPPPKPGNSSTETYPTTLPISRQKAAVKLPEVDST